jgi:hypothetical protein
MFMIWYRDACTLTSHNSGLIHQYKQYQIYLIFISDTCQNAPGYISGFCTISYFACLSLLSKAIGFWLKREIKRTKTRYSNLSKTRIATDKCAGNSVP